MPEINRSNWPKAMDFTAEQWKQLFWTKAQWTAHINDQKGVSVLKSLTNDLDDDMDMEGKDIDTEQKPGKQERACAAEGINMKMKYVVNHDGVPVDGFCATVIRGVACGFWTELSDQGVAPFKWKAESSLLITQNYRSQMENLCEELRFCENGWKADQIAIDNYSLWCNAWCKKGLFNVCVKLKDSKIKQDDEDDHCSSDEPIHTSKKHQGKGKARSGHKKVKRSHHDHLSDVEDADSIMEEPATMLST